LIFVIELVGGTQLLIFFREYKWGKASRRGFRTRAVLCCVVAVVMPSLSHLFGVCALFMLDVRWRMKSYLEILVTRFRLDSDADASSSS